MLPHCEFHNENASIYGILNSTAILDGEEGFCAVKITSYIETLPILLNNYNTNVQFELLLIIRITKLTPY